MECIEIDLNNVCRTCKNECPEMKSLYYRDSESGPRLDEMLMACASVQVNKEDGLPKSICRSCLVQLKNAYSFKEQCEKTDSFLRGHLKNLKKDTVKQEIIADLEERSSSFIGEINSTLNDIGNVNCDRNIENIKGEPESYFDGSRQENVDYIQIVNNNLTIYECCTCSKVLYTLEDLKCHKRIHTDDIEENYMEIGFEDATMFSVEADGGGGNDLVDDGEKVKSEVEVSESNDQEEIHDVAQTATGIYAEEDPLPILMKTKIVEEMYRVTEVKQEGMEVDEKETEVKEVAVDVNNDSEYESDASAHSEYLPTKEKIKRGPGRPRKYPVSLRLTDRSAEPENEIGNFPCPQCKEVFTKTSLLEKHAEQHDALQILKCDSCDKRFSTLNNLKRHKLLHMEIRPFLCMTCRKTFTRNDHLQRHMKFHLKKPIHSCDFCDAVFSRQGNLTKHKDMKHNNSEKIVKEKKKFGCSECGKVFNRNDYLVTHMRRHRGEKPCKCKYCGKGFPRTADLTVHVRYHTGEKRHQCVTCGRRFGRACDLKVHIRIHTGEKPYRCTYCDAAFAQGNDFRAHIRKHTGERFQCELCPRTFIMRHQLTQHKRVVHGLNIAGIRKRLQPVNKLEPDEPQLIIDTDPLQSQDVEVSESKQE